MTENPKCIMNKLWIEYLSSTWCKGWFMGQNADELKEHMLGRYYFFVDYSKDEKTLCNNIALTITSRMFKKGLFLRMDSVSPKDLMLNGQISSMKVTSIKEVLNIMKKSTRINNSITQYPYTLLESQRYIVFCNYVDEHFDEVRIWYSFGRVIAYHHEQDAEINIKKIIQFIDAISKLIPYEEVVIDLAYFKDRIKIVEFNSYGKNMVCRTDGVNWDNVERIKLMDCESVLL